MVPQSEMEVLTQGRAEQPAGQGAPLWHGGSGGEGPGARPLGGAPGKPDAAHYGTEAPARRAGVTATPPTCTCRKLKQVSAHPQTHTYAHTCKGVARTRHKRGRTSAHAHTRLDRQVPPDVRGREEGSPGPRAACERGCTCGISGPPRSAGAGPWRKTLSAAGRWALATLGVSWVLPGRPSPLPAALQMHRVLRDLPPHQFELWHRVLRTVRSQSLHAVRR